MTDIEISKALALAIGWTENRLDENGCLDPDVAVFSRGQFDPFDFPEEVKCWDGDNWRTFNYRDPLVIWPIAEKYGCFPYKLDHPDVMASLQGKWNSITPSGRPADNYADTAAKAVAMAVINREKK